MKYSEINKIYYVYILGNSPFFDLRGSTPWIDDANGDSASAQTGSTTEIIKRITPSDTLLWRTTPLSWWTQTLMPSIKSSPAPLPFQFLLLQSIPPASSPPPSSRRMLSCIWRFLRNLKPKTLVLLPPPCITPNMSCYSLGTSWGWEAIVAPSLMTGDVNTAWTWSLLKPQT